MQYKWIHENEGAHTWYILIFISVYLSEVIIYFIYTLAPLANCKHTVAIALTRRAIYKIYFGIYLLTSFRKPGQFTQRLDRQVTVFIRLIISIDPTAAPSVWVGTRVLFYSQRVFANKINRTEIKVKKGVYFCDTAIGDVWSRVYYTRCACTPSTCVTYSRVRLVANYYLILPCCGLIYLLSPRSRCCDYTAKSRELVVKTRSLNSIIAGALVSWIKIQFSSHQYN